MASSLKASWGVSKSCPSGISGVVTDYSETMDPVAAPLQDEVGADIGHTVYDEHTTATMSVTCKVGAALPSVNSTFKVGDITGYVTNCSVTENNQSYVKFSVTVERWKAEPAIETASSPN